MSFSHGGQDYSSFGTCWSILSANPQTKISDAFLLKIWPLEICWSTVFLLQNTKEDCLDWIWFFNSFIVFHQFPQDFRIQLFKKRKCFNCLILAIHRWSSCTRYCILFSLPISYRLFPFSCSSSLFFFFFDLNNDFSSFCMLPSAIHWPWYFLPFLSIYDKVAQFHCSVALLLPLKNFKMKLVSVQDFCFGFVALWSWTALYVNANVIGVDTPMSRTQLNNFSNLCTYLLFLPTALSMRFASYFYDVIWLAGCHSACTPFLMVLPTLILFYFLLFFNSRLVLVKLMRN